MTPALTLSLVAVAAVVVLAVAGGLDADAAVAFIGGVLLRSPVDARGSTDGG